MLVHVAQVDPKTLCCALNRRRREATRQLQNEGGGGVLVLIQSYTTARSRVVQQLCVYSSRRVITLGRRMMCRVSVGCSAQRYGLFSDWADERFSGGDGGRGWFEFSSDRSPISRFPSSFQMLETDTLEEDDPLRAFDLTVSVCANDLKRGQKTGHLA